VKEEEPAKEPAPAVSVKKQSPVQENPAAVQPVRAAAVEVGEPNRRHDLKRILFMNLRSVVPQSV